MGLVMTYCGAAVVGGTGGRRTLAVLTAGLALATAACGRDEPVRAPPPDTPAAVAARPPAPWFVCDALNAPTVLVVSRPDAGGLATVLTLDKADMHPPVARLYAVGPAQADVGGVLRPLSREGAAAGHVRLLNLATLPRPGDAATDPVVEVKLEDGPALSCRWLLRTRLFGVAAGRTVLVTDEDDGPLLRTFDFKAPTGGRVMPDGVQRSSLPTIRMGAGKARGGSYVFANEGYGYTVDAGGVSVTQDGRATSAEPFIAVQQASRAN
jgi:hypothetical protein